VLVRSDSISYLTVAGREAMLAYGITTVIDLRTESELQGVQDERFPRAGAEGLRADGVRYVHRPLVDDGSVQRIGQATNMLERYLAILQHRREAFSDVFTSLAEAKGGALFHCMAGKDRTGLIAAMALSLAGVPNEHIAADFAQTDRQLARQYELWIAAAAPDKQDAMRDELRCPPERILAVLDHLEGEWGGVDAYLEAAGVAPADIDRVSSRLA
jgi:protein-tyrosine phosphatase